MSAADDDDSPSVIGPAPTAEEFDAMLGSKEAWRARFIARLIALGWDQEDATACYEADGDQQPWNESPEEMADDMDHYARMGE